MQMTPPAGDLLSAHARPSMTASPRRTVTPALCVVWAAALSVAMVLVPPFTSVSGTEYAFVLSGPAWARTMVAVDLGLTARLHWPLLFVQLAAVWTLALGAWWAVGGSRPLDGAA